MLNEEAIRTLVSDLWMYHQTELIWLDRIYGYAAGQLGRPQVPEGSEQEVKDLASLSVKNVLSLVRDSFTQNLSVIGYRDAAADSNASGWKMWQSNRMDARQAEVYRPAVTYGAAYVVVTNEQDGTLWRTRSPRQLLAVYEDPQVDVWPQYAFETWIDSTDAKPRRKALLYDDTYMYPLDLGDVPAASLAEQNASTQARNARIDTLGEPRRHGADQCPVVRFVNGRDADDLIVGEIAPLINLQKAINEVNFDRLIVSRFGAFPQKVISGWTSSPTEVLKASAKRIWTFDDPNVTAQSLPAADVTQYNAVLSEMLEHVAMVAQISPAQVVGKLVNISAEALTAAEANQQRKIASKRDSFGESWEQVFALAAEISGGSASGSDGSEVVWRDTEARTFASIVDGVVKLATAGVPIEEMLGMVPGMTQQQITKITKKLEDKQAEAEKQFDTPPELNGSAPPMPPMRPSPASMPKART